jgi:hypothetical protein
VLVASITLMLEAASTSETSKNFYHITWRYNPEDSHLQEHNISTSKGGRSLRSEFSSPKVTRKFMYTLVAKAPILSYNPLNIE